MERHLLCYTRRAQNISVLMLGNTLGLHHLYIYVYRLVYVNVLKYVYMKCVVICVYEVCGYTS